MYINRANAGNGYGMAGANLTSRDSASQKFAQDPSLFTMGKMEPIQSDELFKLSGGLVFPNVRTNFLKTSSLAQYRQYPQSVG